MNYRSGEICCTRKGRISPCLRTILVANAGHSKIARFSCMAYVSAAPIRCGAAVSLIRAEPDDPGALVNGGGLYRA
jgi:hypothetical protein